MTKKRRLHINIIYPSTDAFIRKTKKVDLEGHFQNKALGLTAPVKLHPNMLVNQGKDLFIDGEAHLQIKPSLNGRWVGPDPRVHYGLSVRDINRELKTRGVDWGKFGMYGLIFLFLCLAAIIAMAIIAIS